MPLFDTVLDPHAEADVVRRRRYGVIQAAEGRLLAVHFRPWPKLASLPEAWWQERRRPSRRGDRCLVYFNQPLSYSRFLAVTFAVSSRDCTVRTLHAARRALETIAEIKQADALLCDAWNTRISERLLRRWGWEPHTKSRWHRNFIRRFYGVYPTGNSAGRQISVAMQA
jgi:hypothetical protein